MAATRFSRKSAILLCESSLAECADFLSYSSLEFNDLCPCDFFLWGYLKAEVSGHQPQNLKELKGAVGSRTRNRRNSARDDSQSNMALYRENLQHINFSQPRLRSNILF